MKIDCQTCPARRVACDGCMMQFLFDPLTCDDTVSDGAVAVVSAEPAERADLLAAIAVFQAASMVSTADAASARDAIVARQSAVGGRHLRVLRAS